MPKHSVWEYDNDYEYWNRKKRTVKMGQTQEIITLNEKQSIRHGMATTIALCIAGNYITLFAINVLGASNYQVGLLSSLPQFVGLFAMIIGSVLLARLEERKKFTAIAFLCTRLFFLVLFFVIYLPVEYRSWVFVILVGFMNFPGSIATLSWQSFIGDLIPDYRRNQFFSERNRILTIVGMITTFLIGILLQQFNPSNPFPFQLLFLIGFLCGIVELFFLLKHREGEKEKKATAKKFTLGLSVLKYKPFLYFIICGLIFNFGWQMAWSLFNIYHIKFALANGLWISLFAVINQIAQIASFKWWGRMAEKHSNAKMLILVAIGMGTTPFLTILSTNLYYLLFVNASSGLFVSGTVLLLFNQLLEVTNEENRTVCISNYNILLAIVAFIAPQFGVFLLEMISMDVAMTVSSLLRAGSGLLFLWLFLYLKKRKQAVQLV